jgi:hypothetical protein
MGYCQTIPLYSFEIGSSMNSSFNVGTVVGTSTFTTDITVPSWLDGKIIHAYVDAVIPYVVNLSGALNYTFNDQYIQVSISGGAWQNVIAIPSLSFTLPGAERMCGTIRLIGTVDLTSLGIDSATLRFRWLDKQAVANSLEFTCLYMVLRIIGES